MTLRIALPGCTTPHVGAADDAPLHAALRARGCEVETPAWDDAAIDWAGFDATLIRTTWDYMDRRGKFVEWARHVARKSRLFNPWNIIEWNTLKTYLRDLEARAVPIAPTIWLEPGSCADIAALVADRDWEEAFLKPMIGATARETLPFRTDAAGIAAAQAHVDRLLPAEGMLIQPFLASVQTEGEYSVIFIDGEVTHAVRKIPVPGDYRVMDDFGATDESVELPEADLQTATRVREVAEDILGCDTLLYARVDFLRDAMGQLVVNELELVEPSLFFRHGPGAAEALADGLLRRIA